MTHFRRLFSLLLLALLASACPSTGGRVGVPIERVQLPDWARSGQHPSYPDEQFLAAYALADAPLTARRNSRQGLENAICQEALKLGEPMIRGSRFAEALRGQSAWIALEGLQDAVKFDFATNGFESVAVSAISRDELRLRVAGLLEQARKDFAAQERPMDFSDLRRHLEGWARHFLVSVRVVALGFLAGGELERPAFAQAEDAALRLWDVAAQMTVLQQGQDQFARIAGGLQDELVFSATFRDKPAVDVPLAWSIEAPCSGVLDNLSLTDVNGMARCKVYSLFADGRRYAQIRAEIDLDGIAGRALGLTSPLWRWRVALPARVAGELLFTVKETIDGKAADSAFGPVLLEWCKQNRLACTDDPKQPPSEGRRYRLLLSGSLKAVVYKDGESVSARAEGTLTLSDAETGQAIYVYSPAELRGMGKDETPAEAARRALIEASADAVSQLGPRILAALPEPPK